MIFIAGNGFAIFLVKAGDREGQSALVSFAEGTGGERAHARRGKRRVDTGKASETQGNGLSDGGRHEEDCLFEEIRGGGSPYRGKLRTRSIFLRDRWTQGKPKGVSSARGQHKIPQECGPGMLKILHIVFDAVPQLAVVHQFIALPHTEKRVGGENVLPRDPRASSCVSCALLHLLQAKGTRAPINML